MVGQEGRTQIPVLKYYSDKGFDPEKDMLQSYGTGWKSASFLGQERQLFGAPGGIITDWNLMTNVEGIYAAGDQLYAMDCGGAAAATGYYAGRKASDYAASAELSECPADQAADEKKRLLAPYFNQDRDNSIEWKELNHVDEIVKVIGESCNSKDSTDNAGDHSGHSSLIVLKFEQHALVRLCAEP